MFQKCQQQKWSKTVQNYKKWFKRSKFVKIVYYVSMMSKTSRNSPKKFKMVKKGTTIVKRGPIWSKFIENNFTKEVGVTALRNNLNF